MSRDKEKDAYRLRQRRLACENIRFEVFLDDVENPNGEIVQNYLVVAPKIKTGDLVTGVAVLPVVDGKLGLLRIYRHAIQRHLWEVPRGFIDPGESDRKSALRELEEETGLSCADADLESLGIFAPEPGLSPPGCTCSRRDVAAPSGHSSPRNLATRNSACSIRHRSPFCTMLAKSGFFHTHSVSSVRQQAGAIDYQW